jgi:hypothetical protein
MGMERWNIGRLGFDRIDPSFHPSTIPNLTMLDQTYESLSTARSYL